MMVLHALGYKDSRSCAWMDILVPRSTTRLYTFPNAPTESSTELTIRLQNILHSPTISRYEVTYKLYRRQSERLMTLQFGSSTSMYCYCGSSVYELGADFEPVLLKLKMWTLRQTMKIAGSVHELDNQGLGNADKCQISVGVINQGPSTKGVVIDLQQASSDLLPTEGHVDEQVLRDVMGSRFQTLMVPNNSATSVVLCTGSDLPLLATTMSDKLQMASAYFEMFSKL